MGVGVHVSLIPTAGNQFQLEAGFPPHSIPDNGSDQPPLVSIISCGIEAGNEQQNVYAHRRRKT
jgi:hypothetical protein